MKKKEAIKRIADELQKRDHAACERATEAAGGAATVTAITKDYEALAKGHLDRALMELACERAMQNIETARRQDKAVGPPPPPPPPQQKVQLKGSDTQWVTLTPKAAGFLIQDLINSGWGINELRSNGYIL